LNVFFLSFTISEIPFSYLTFVKHQVYEFVGYYKHQYEDSKNYAQFVNNFKQLRKEKVIRFI